MHQGQIPGPPNPTASVYSNQQHGGGIDISEKERDMANVPLLNGIHATPAPAQPHQDNVSSSFTTMVGQDHSSNGPHNNVHKAAETQIEVDTKRTEAEKKGKKDKDKNVKMVYSDNEISPEEKMAGLPRYAFVPNSKEEAVLGDATTATVAGVADDAFDQ